MISRRSFFIGATTTPFLSGIAGAADPITVTRDPNCGCCLAWANHLRAEGFAVTIVNDAQLNRVKARLGVPAELFSCHTAEIEGYVVEGHVPASSIRKLLAQRPKIRGLAVPGMPIGSPGMEVKGSAPEIYAVIAFGPNGQTVFARYEGAQQLPAS